MKTEPIKALEELKHCAWTAEYFNISDGFESYEVVDENDAINISNIAFREGQSNPKIKQLEWDEWDDYDSVYFDSISAVGHYIVVDGDKFSEASYRFALFHNGNLVHYFESLDEAKAAAQTDFEQRVMECLDLKAQ